MPPQNIGILWHKDYFEAPESQQLEEGYSKLPFSFWKQEMELPSEQCPPYTMRKEKDLSPELRVKEGGSLYKETFLK